MAPRTGLSPGLINANYLRLNRGVSISVVFRRHAAGLCASEVGHDEASMPAVAIDGKTLRHSFDTFNDRKATHVLGAFAIDDTSTLGHLEVNQKSNEISAAQAMIEALALAGRPFTLDAMHCQKNYLWRPVKQTVICLFNSRRTRPACCPKPRQSPNTPHH